MTASNNRVSLVLRHSSRMELFVILWILVVLGSCIPVSDSQVTNATETTMTFQQCNLNSSTITNVTAFHCPTTGLITVNCTCNQKITLTTTVKRRVLITTPPPAPRTCSPACSTNSHCNMVTLKCQCNSGYLLYGTTCRAFCAAQTRLIGTTLHSFPQTWLNEVAYSNQKCANDSRPKASLKCNSVLGDVALRSPVSVSCNTTLLSITSVVSQAANSSDVETYSAKLSILSHKNMTTTETDETVKAITQLSTTSQVNENSFQNVLQSTNNILKQNTTVTSTVFSEPAKSTAFIEALNSYASKVKLPAHETSHTFTTPTVACEVKKHTNTTTHLTFAWSDPTIASSSYKTKESVSTIVPPSILTEISSRADYNASTLRFYSFRYPANSTLMKLPPNATFVVSLGVTMNERNLNTTFRSSIKIEYSGLNTTSPKQRLSNDPFRTKLTQADCAYLQSNGSWQTSAKAIIGNTTVCYQKTPGSFSALFASRVVPSDVVLTIVSKIGCILSIIGLAITVIVYCGIKTLRDRQPTPIMMNVCVCLIVVYLTFLSGIQEVQNYNACYAAAIILHTALISAWAWMFVNAINMYMSFVKVFTSGLGRKLSAYLIAYGGSITVVAINVCVAIFYADKDKARDIYFESSYRARNMCWIHNKSLYFGLLVPIGILLVGNFVLFGAIITTMLRPTNNKIRSTATKSSTTKELLMAVSLITMMGLTWIFGYFLLISTEQVYATIMSWMFTVLNTTQGLLIFVMMCVRQPKVRALWLDPIFARICCCSKQTNKKNSMTKSTATSKL